MCCVPAFWFWFRINSETNPIQARMFSTYSTEVNEGMILQGGVPGGNRWHVWVYLGLQVQHGLLKGLGWRPLVVTEYSDGTIGPVVRQDLGWDALIRCAQREEIGRASCRERV